jgi:hypothetical protein
MTDVKTKRPWYVNCLFALGAFVVLIIIIAALGGGGSSSTDNTTGGGGTTQERPSEEAMVVTATQLYAAYKTNEVAADNTYKGKLLEISGTIDTIGKDILDSPYVALKTGEVFGSVQCMLSDEAIAQAGSLTPGAKITLRGRGNGYLLNALVKDCDIVQK